MIASSPHVLLGIIETQRARIRELETQLLDARAPLQAQIDYRHVLDKTPKFGSNGNLRSFVYHANEYERTHKPMADGDHKGLYFLNMADIAASYGCAGSNAGDQAHKLKAAGHMDYETEDVTDELTGEKRTHSYGRLHAELKSTEGLDTLDVEPLAINGGADRWLPCPICGKRQRKKKTTLWEQTILTCEDGHEFVMAPERVAKTDMRYLQQGGKYVDVEQAEIRAKTTMAYSTDTTVGGSCSSEECQNHSGSEEKAPKPQWFENTPAELQARAQWIDWRYGRMRSSGKREKPPYDAKLASPRPAQSCDDTNPANFASFKVALDKWQESQSWKIPYEGIGFCLTPDDPYCAIDKDNCRDKETGVLDESATNLVESIKTYWEVSPSGTGIRGIVKAQISKAVDTSELELYDREHYVTFTGWQLTDTTNTIADAQPEIDALVLRVAPAAACPIVMVPMATATTCVGDDTELLARAMHDAKFARLMAGDTTGYASLSQADMALANKLRFYAGDDFTRIDTLGHRSKLYREKWDRSAGAGLTYWQRTIYKALGAHPATPPVDTKPSPVLPQPLPTIFTPSSPCPECSLPFSRQLAEYTVCVRCSPPKGGYPDEWDRLYPRAKMKAPIELAPAPMARKKKSKVPMATTLLAAVMPL